MRDKISLLIADDNIEFGNLLRDYIKQEDDIEVVDVARDGIQAVEMIMTLAPDVVVLDIIMPNLDGIGVLEKIAVKQLIKKPLFIILSAIGQDVFVQQAIKLGVEYYIVKPFDTDVLISRIRQVYRERYASSFSPNSNLTNNQQVPAESMKTGINLEVEVVNLMMAVGVPPHMTGYQYIKEAIIFEVKEYKTLNSYTKILYPAVAKKFNTTPQRVERAIRNAIESTWTRGNQDSISELFGYTVNLSKSKPASSEFIAMMSERIRVGLECNQQNSSLMQRSKNL